MANDERNDEQQIEPGVAQGAPGGARHHVRSETEQGAVARPGGATQNSGGAIVGNAEQNDPGRGAD